MVDGRGCVLAQDFVQASAVLYAADLGVERDVGEGLAHLAVNFEQRGLGNFESDNAGGLEACDLPAEFGADRSGGAGHENDFATEGGADIALVKANRVAAQEVFDSDVADLIGQTIRFDNFRETGDSLIGDTGFVAAI